MRGVAVAPALGVLVRNLCSAFGVAVWCAAALSAVSLSSIELSSAKGDTRVVVVAGLGGEPAYEEAFREQAHRVAVHVRNVAEHVTLLEGERATADAVRAALGDAARRSTADDTLVLMLFGHGTFDGRQFKFNLPGPDVTAEALRDALDAIAAARQLVVVSASASGAAQETLQRAGRMVITATKSGGESHAPRFGQYFVEALGEAAADTDKDGGITSSEAFAWADRRVADYFASRERIATEHPRAEPEGPVALTLARFAPTVPVHHSVAPLVKRRQEIEAEIDALRATKEVQDPEVYYGTLQRLLLDLAVVERQIETDSAAARPAP